MTPSIEVTWPLDGITMHGTLTTPDGTGPFPGVVMVAGSGPTDRDWNSPLLPGENGSGRLIAEALAGCGVASLRYDKRASGPHVAENLPRLIGRISMESHLDELAAAIEVLTGRDEVDATRIIGLGNSEGCLHLLHYAIAPRTAALVGLILLAPPGRSVGDLLVSQLSQQLSLLPGSDTLKPMVAAAAARYSAGQPMNPDPALPENVRMVMAGFETPANLPFARELWSEDATGTLPQVKTPTLVVIGEKDLQVDARIDGDRLQAASRGMGNVQFEFPPNTNHVLKEDLRTVAEIAASGDPRYNDPESHLDPRSVELIVSWLRKVAGLKEDRT